MNDPSPATAISPLRQRLIDDMNVRRFSRETQRNYIRDVGRGESGETPARAGNLRAHGAGRVSLLSRLPANDAEAASLHRSREEPLGRYQQNPKSH